MITFINTTTPWSNDTARNALDMIMMAVSLDQPVQVFFADDGVYQLLGQQAQALESKNPLVKYRVLTDIFELDAIFVLESALAARNLSPSQLQIDAQPISDADFTHALQRSTKVVRF